MAKTMIMALFGNRHDARRALDELRDSYIGAPATVMSADYAGWSEAEIRERGGTEGGAGLLAAPDAAKAVRLAAVDDLGPLALSAAWPDIAETSPVSRKQLSAALVRDGAAADKAEEMIAGVLRGGTVLRFAVDKTLAGRTYAIMAGNEALLLN